MPYRPPKPVAKYEFESQELDSPKMAGINSKK